MLMLIYLGFNAKIFTRLDETSVTLIFSVVYCCELTDFCFSGLLISHIIQFKNQNGNLSSMCLISKGSKIEKFGLNFLL